MIYRFNAKLKNNKIMNWKYKIDIKKHFVVDTTKEVIETLCKILVKELDKILIDSQKSNISEESLDDFWYELEECKDNFEFLLQICNGEIEEKDYEDFGFNGNFESEFNDYLEQLYDGADTVITLKSGEKSKLLWIG